MINICHPKIHGKPPAKEFHPATRPTNPKDVREESDEVETRKTDHNRNIVEPSVVSFQQLCEMISGIEKSIASDDGPQVWHL